MLYLLVGVALGVWNKTLQNCSTLDKAVIAATALFFFIKRICNYSVLPNFHKVENKIPL